ncbi:unnamed protein product [Candidula unifasciata]|uniref:Protein kinase domain-containing protein n=1 Tax=Candidula unifasciata TaxID=100452 RepID=A0A8S3YB70_9EUPU|nr:unnamed protein product [Candidula unifasciata]
MIVAVVLSIAFPVCFVALLIGCLDCLFKKRRLEGFRSRDATDGRHTNAFSVDICDVPSTSEQVTIEPLPDILSKVSVAPALRPQITFVDRGEHASTAPLISVQRSFPRDHLTYLNEIGSGWFGKAIESEAIQIVGGSLKSHVVVKMLKDDASKLEQKQFLDEVHAYRCLDHANLMSLLGQCTETAPFLVILEFAAYGSLKSFLVEHSQDQETLVAKNRYISFALDAAAGLACLHRHDYIHNDLAARNCLVMSDYTLKIGDYGISDNLFKNEYYNTGTELLPVRWMAPETLVKSNGVWTTQPHNKMSDMWSFGILLWEICAVGERPYDMLTDEAVLQGVVQDKLLLPSDVDMKLPFKDRLWSVMTQCWRDASHRLDVVQAYDSLKQLIRVRVDTVDAVSDFDQKWNQLKQNQERAPGNDTDLGSRIALAGSFATDDSSSPPDKPSLLDSDGGAYESIQSDDFIIDVGDADEMHAPVYQSPATVLANSVKATEIPVQAIIHRRISDSSEDQIFVENEFTNTSVLQSQMAPIQSVDQTAGTYERHISPILPDAKMKDINIVKNDLSLEVKEHFSNVLTSEAQEEDNANASCSNFESRLLTDDEDFSDFVRTSPTAPSLDFTDFASADISAHDVHVDRDQQFENEASSDVPGSDIETRKHADMPVGAAAKNISLDHDLDAFSDFVTSDPPHKFGTMEILTENLDTAPFQDKNPGLTEKKDNPSLLGDDKGTSDSDSDTFSDFVSSVPTQESDRAHDAKLTSTSMSNSGNQDIASVSVLSSQDRSLDISFPKPVPESQTQMENLSTAPPNTDIDLQMQGSLKDFGYDSETSSAAVDFNVKKTSGEKITADHNQNIFSSELFPSDLSSLSSDMSLLIHDSLATSIEHVPVYSKQPEHDADIGQLSETSVQLPETDIQFPETNVHQLPETNVQFPETDVHQLSETDVQFPETDVQFPETDVQFPETDVQFPETDVQFPETDVQFPETDVQFPETDVHQLPETNVQFPKTDVQFPEIDVQFPETDVHQLPETNVQFPETDVHQFPETNESGNLDVQPGMSFDLLDSQLGQGSGSSSIMSVVEILGKETSPGATQVEALDAQFGFDLMPPAVGPQAQQDDLITDLHKSNGDVNATPAEQVEQPLINF